MFAVLLASSRQQGHAVNKFLLKKGFDLVTCFTELPFPHAPAIPHVCKIRSCGFLLFRLGFANESSSFLPNVEFRKSLEGVKTLQR